jgi:dienelactone hydrolase
LDYFFFEKENELAEILVRKMDLNRIGAFGQSFGGAISGQLCLRDSRVSAGVNLDGFQFGDIIDEPLQDPFMLIQSGYNDLWNYGNSAIFSNTEADFYFIDIPKARHLVFSDAALLPSIPLENRLDMLGDINESKVLGDLNRAILDFFDIYLKDKDPSFLSSTHPFEGATLRFTPRNKHY